MPSTIRSPHYSNFGHLQLHTRSLPALPRRKLETSRVEHVVSQLPENAPPLANPTSKGIKWN